MISLSEKRRRPKKICEYYETGESAVHMGESSVNSPVSSHVTKLATVKSMLHAQAYECASSEHTSVRAGAANSISSCTNEDQDLDDEGDEENEGTETEDGEIEEGQMMPGYSMNGLEEGDDDSLSEVNRYAINSSLNNRRKQVKPIR